LLEQLKKCGFDICESKRKKKVKASKA